MPLPILSPIGLLLLAHMPRATVLACLVAMLSASPTCYCTSLSCRAHVCLLCPFLAPLQRTDPLDFHKHCPWGRSDHLSGDQLNWLSILNFMKPPALFLTQALATLYPSVPDSDLPSLSTAPAPVRPFSLPSFSVHAPTCLHCQTQKCHGGFNMPGVIHLADYYKGN